MNFVPTGTMSAVVLVCANGDSLDMSVLSHEASEVIKYLGSRAPWAALGYSPSMEKAMEPEVASQTIRGILEQRSRLTTRRTV